MTREAQKLIFADGEIPTGLNYSDLLDQIPLILATTADLPTAAAGNLGQVYCVGGVNYKCTNPSTGVYEWTNMNAAAAANDYANVSNKPKINDVLLSGNKDGDALKLLSNFSVLATGADPLALTSNLATDDAGDTSVSVKRTVQDLYDLFDIANLPKYEKQFNPLLTTSGGFVVWTITHTCKTATPVIQIYRGDGLMQNTETLPDLIITHKTSTIIQITWTVSSNIPANSYYVVLIG